MFFVSTRNHSLKATFREAVFQGLAPDGGLYYPKETRNLSQVFESFPSDVSFLDVATKTSTVLLEEEFSETEIIEICKRAFSFSPSLSTIEPDITILELFHGPSCAFKDFGASFLAVVMEKLISDRGGRAIVLTATSGDTGSAVAEAFSGTKGIDVVILYPSGRVSPLQEKQLTTVGGNVHALEVKGSFDDCQRMVKEAFLDPNLNESLPLTSANSINLGRLIPQAYYYIWAWTRLRSKPQLSFCVPSGNFGNMTAGVLAWQWGLEVSQFIAATNTNDVVPEYLRTSVFSPRASIHTYSNAMDVGNPSNFERLVSLFHGNWKEMQKMLTGEIVTDSETLEGIRGMWERGGRAIDPHTAVGYLASRRHLGEGSHIVTLATAHPAKFSEIVEKATGVSPVLPEQLADALSKTKKSTIIEPKVESLAEYLRKNL